MNRLYHLKETLPMNLINNSTYKNVEFVVLNYNSNDEIDLWVEKEMIAEIRSQKLRYIKTLDPMHFKMSHAKNMVTRFANGDIICNIDADNFTGSGFAEYVNQQFSKDKNIFLTGGGKDTMGRVCLWKADFLRLRGYDEKILDWGYEDTDFYYRVNDQIGRTEVKILDFKHLLTIEHDEFERMKNGIYNSEIEFGLVLETENIIKAYVLKKNNKFEYLIITPNSGNSLSGALIDKDKIRCGNWTIKKEHFQFRDDDCENIITFPTNDGGQTYIAPEGVYKKTPKSKVCFYYSMLKGQLAYYENATFKQDINLNGFGEGLVFEPFAHLI